MKLAKSSGSEHQARIDLVTNAPSIADHFGHSTKGSEISTLRVGGDCPDFQVARNRLELMELVRADLRTDHQFRDRSAVCIGGGSNLLISDEGFKGLLVQFRDDGATAIIDRKSGVVRANAAMPWDRLVEEVVEAGLQGLECISGVPGTVGGAVVQNAGAYGQEIADCIRHVELLDTIKGEYTGLARRRLKFGYRTSSLKKTKPPRFIVVGVTLQLSVNPSFYPAHGEVLADLRSSLGSGPYSLERIRASILRIRASKGMLVSTQLEPSAGSFFVNPHLDKSEYHKLQQSHPQLSHVPSTDMRKRGRLRAYNVPGYRLAAAAMIEMAGFPRGYRLGNAAVSSRHALALVNSGDAKADEIATLALQIQFAVREMFGITLVPEPVLLGFEKGRLLGDRNSIPQFLRSFREDSVGDE